MTQPHQGERLTLPETLPLAGARVLLWAHDDASDAGFEVSKAVTRSLQARCPTAPACPSEPLDPFSGPAWIDPDEGPRDPCPYAFRRRGQCLLHRNREALEAALLTCGEARRATRLLTALGYRVRAEGIDPSGRGNPRILLAHSALDDTDEVRVLPAPGGGRLVLVRPHREGTGKLRVCETT